MQKDDKDKLKEINNLQEQLSLYKRYYFDNVLDYYKIPSNTEIKKMEIDYPDINNPQKKREPIYDFISSNTKEYTHCFHSYPAMMIPQIARKLINEYSKKSDVVLDPFCGSGSVLVESKIKGLKAYGFDINPLATLLAQVKTTPLDINKVVIEYKKIIASYKKKYDVQIPSFFNRDYWFKKIVSIDLAKLKDAIDKVEINKIRNFFYVIFSETVRDCSNTRNSEFKLYRLPPNKLKNFNPNVIESFEKKFMRNLEGLKRFNDKIREINSSISVLNEDVRKKTTLKSHSINLLITSPPYGDSKTTVAYGQFSRLSLQWLGFKRKNINTDKLSLGGRITKSDIRLESQVIKKIILLIAKKDQKRAFEVLNFFIDLQKCFNEFRRIMKNQYTLCFVLGNRTVKGVKIPTDEIIREMGEKIGWKYEKTIIRRIPNKKMPTKNSPTNIKGDKGKTMTSEYIVIFNNRSFGNV